MTIFRPGQVWEIRRGDYPDDPMVQEIHEVDLPYVSVRTYLKSSPSAILSRGWMHHSSVSGSGVLVAGPGALHERVALVEHARVLLLYAAQHDGVPHRDGIAVIAEPMIEMIAEDTQDRLHARLILREAVGTLGGGEGDAGPRDDGYSWPPRKPPEAYIVPTEALESKEPATIEDEGPVIRFVRSASPGSWDVLADDAVIGRVEKHDRARRTHASRDPKLAPLKQRHGDLWYGRVDNVTLDDIDRTRMHQQLATGKTTRQAAAQLLIAAYHTAGVVRPTPDDA